MIPRPPNGTSMKYSLLERIEINNVQSYCTRIILKKKLSLLDVNLTAIFQATDKNKITRE